MLNLKKQQLVIPCLNSGGCCSSEMINVGSLTMQGQGCDKSVKINIEIHLNAKLEKMFPVDDNANVKILCGSQVYSLNKAHLRIESEYFAQIFEVNED